MEVEPQLAREALSRLLDSKTFNRSAHLRRRRVPGDSFSSLLVPNWCTEADRMRRSPRLAKAAPATAFDDEGGVVWMNPCLRRLLGYGEDEDLSSAILSDFYDEPEYERILQKAYPDAVLKGSWRDRVVMRTRDGQSVETLHHIEAGLDADGNFVLTFRVEEVSNAEG